MASLLLRKKRRTSLTVITQVPSSAAWKEAAGRKAQELEIPLSEYIVRVVAEALGDPNLAIIPRKPAGRPRKKLKVA
jgi:hypothetical protein